MKVDLLRTVRLRRARRDNRVRQIRSEYRVSLITRFRARVQSGTDDRSAGMLLAAACGLVIAWVINVPIGILVGVVLALNPTRKTRNAARTKQLQLEREVPATADLLAVAIGAGYSTTVALEAVVASTTGALSDSLGDALRRTGAGARLCDCLGEAAELMPVSARPLFDLLISSEREGAPISEGLARLAAALRRSQSRRSRAVARRLPVLLLAPMTCCILPAFALLVVAPVMVEGFSSLDLLLPRQGQTQHLGEQSK